MKNKVLSGLRIGAILLFTVALCLGLVVSLRPAKTEASAEGSVNLTLYAVDAATYQPITTMDSSDTTTEVLIYGKVTENANPAFYGIEYQFKYEADIFDYANYTGGTDFSVGYVSPKDLYEKLGAVEGESMFASMFATSSGWPMQASTSQGLCERYGPKMGQVAITASNGSMGSNFPLTGGFYTGGIKLKLKAGASISNGQTTTITTIIETCKNNGENDAITITANTKDVTITFKAAGAPEAEVTGDITLNSKKFNPHSGDPSRYIYSETVPYTTSSISLSTLSIPVSEGATKTMTFEGGTVTTANTINLKVGDNEITVVIKSSDSKITKTITLVITREGPSTVDTLSTLKLSISGGSDLVNPNGGTLASTTSFTASPDVAYSQRDKLVLTVSQTDTVSRATITLDSSPLESSFSGSKTTNLASQTPGKHTIKVSVQAQDPNRPVKEYTIDFTVTAANTDVTLATLTVTAGSTPATLNPTFTPGGSDTSFTASVPYGTKSVVVAATATASTSSVTGDTGTKTVSDGTQLTITVTAESGARQNYIITIKYLPDTDCSLTGLSVDIGGSPVALSPSFSKTVYSYNISVPHDTTQVNVTATPAATASVSGDTGLVTVVDQQTLTVTVTAQDTTSTQQYTIKVNFQEKPKDTVNTLSNLVITLEDTSPVTLSPTFSSDTTSYTVTVPYGTSKLIVTPTTTSLTASANVNGEVTIPNDNYTIRIVVTPESGTPTKTYQVKVQYAARDTDNTLSSLTIMNSGSPVALSPDFSSTTTSYTVTVPKGTSSLDVTATPTSNKARVSGDVDTVTITSSGQRLTITVTAENETTKNYYVTVNYILDSDNDLATLEVLAGGSPATLTPIFSAAVTSYTASVPYNTKQVTVNATAAGTAKVTAGTGVKSVSNNTQLTVTVRAENGQTKDYTITIEYLPDTDTDLRTLTVKANGSNISLNPAFSAKQTSYSITVPYGTTEVTITATAASTASIDGDGVQSVYNGATLTVTVTAQDGSSTQNYTIEVTVAQDTDNTLKSLEILVEGVAKPLSPAFSSGNTNYTVIVPYDTKQVTVNATCAETANIISGNNNPVSVNDGFVITIIVAAQNGVTKDYKVTIRYDNPTLDGNSDLATLSVALLNNDPVTLNPGFSASETNYNISVPYGTRQVVVTATAAGKNANVNGAGTVAVTNGGTIRVTVTAENGTSKVYNIKVTFLADTDCDLISLSVTANGQNVPLNPTFSSDQTSYSISLPFGTKQVIVDATAASTATITGNGQQSVTNGGTLTITVRAQDGTSTKTYTISVSIDAGDSDNTLSNLTVTANGQSVSLNPTFSPSETTYSISLPFGTTEVTVNATKASNTASISGDTGTVAVTNGKQLKITVKAQDGSTKEYVINVSIDAGDNDSTLARLTVSVDGATQMLNPGFTPGVTSYNVTLPFGTKQATVEAIPTSATSTVTSGNGTFSVNTGDVLTVTVEAQDGSTTSYYINVTIDPGNNDATLANLRVTADGKNIPLNPSFTSNNSNYDITLPFGTTEVTVTAVPTELTSTVISGDGLQSVTNGGLIQVTIRAQDGTTKSYYINVTIDAGNGDNTLANLTVTSGGKSVPLSPGFSPATSSYSISLPFGTTEVTVNAIPTEETSTVTSGNGVHTVRDGDMITVTVRAQNGKTKNYYINVSISAGDNDNRLGSLTVTANGENVPLDPAFNANQTSYNVTLPYGTTEIDVEASATSDKAQVSGTGKKTVKTGDTITVTVEAQDGTTKEYTITVTVEEADTDNTLASLTVSLLDGTEMSLSPAFTSGNTTYSVTLPFRTTQVNVGATLSSDKAQIVSGTGTQGVYDGSVLKVTVKAQDGSTKDYIINVKVESASSDKTLSDLNASVDGTDLELSPKFNPNQEDYTVTVPKGKTVDDVDIDATPSSDNADVKVEKDAKNGKIKVTVTAEDGTKKEYTITVEEEKDSDNTLGDLNASVDGTDLELSPKFNPNQTDYTVTVPKGKTAGDVDIDAIPSSDNADVEVEKDVKNGKIKVTVTAEDGTKKEYTITVKEDDDGSGNNPGGNDPNNPNNPNNPGGNTPGNDPNNPGGGNDDKGGSTSNTPGGNNPGGNGGNYPSDPNDPNQPGGGAGNTPPKNPNYPGAKKVDKIADSPYFKDMRVVATKKGEVIDKELAVYVDENGRYIVIIPADVDADGYLVIATDVPDDGYTVEGINNIYGISKGKKAEHKVHVIDGNHVAIRTTTIDIIYEGDNNAALKVFVGDTWYDMNGNSLKVKVDSETSATRIIADVVGSDLTAWIRFEGTLVDFTSYDKYVGLDYGENKVEIVILALDGSTVATYTITIVRDTTNRLLNILIYILLAAIVFVAIVDIIAFSVRYGKLKKK